MVEGKVDEEEVGEEDAALDVSGIEVAEEEVALDDRAEVEVEVEEELTLRNTSTLLLSVEYILPPPKKMPNPCKVAALISVRGMFSNFIVHIFLEQS